MKAFSSLAAVVALWLGVSFSLWLFYRLFRRRDGSRQKRLTAAGLGLVEEGVAVFDALRLRAPERAYGWNCPREALQDDVRALLNGIEAKSAYFDRVKAAKLKIEKAFGVADFAPLAEILQIRRDFWAASEIFLIEDIRALGAELAQPEAYEAFRGEALTLLFQAETQEAREGDPVALRLSIAREEAVAFDARVDEVIAAELEKGRAPTPSEVISVPMTLARSAAYVVREGRTIFADAAATAQTFARAVGSKGLKAAAEELRKARGDLPGQFASAFERAGGLARKGGEGLKRHYEFLLEAQELRARYAELLARAPILTEKGKQFLARLELEKHAEQVRETSGDAADWTRQRIVIGIAHLIRALQYVQAKITPIQNKQLAVVSAAREEDAAGNVSEEPLRAMLLPSASYAGRNRGRVSGRGRKARTNAATESASGVMAAAHTPSVRLRDLVSGDAAASVPERANPGRPAAFKGSGSLMDRLSTIDHEEQAPAGDYSTLREKADLKRQSSRPVKSARR